jgi:hypothetical protein
MITKNNQIGLVIIVILLVVIYYFFLRGNFNTETRLPINIPDTNTPMQNLSPVGPVEPETHKPSNVDQAISPKIGKQEFLPPPKPAANSINIDDYSYTIENKKNDIMITPGMTLKHGKGINLKLPSEKATLQLQRDNTYRSNEFKVIFEKKY